MTTGQISCLHRRLGDNFVKLACVGARRPFDTDWLVWLFENESRMIGREWGRAWIRQATARGQAALDYGYHGG